MAVNINADTTTGLELTSDTSGNINIQNDGTTVVAVTSSGAAVTGNLTVDTDTLYVDATNNRVGIGTSSPSVKFQVNDGSASSNATMKIMNTANANTNFGCAIQFANQDPTYYMGQIAALRTNTAVNYSSYLTFSYSSNTTITEGMRLDSSGNLLFNSGYGSVATAYGCRAWVNFNGSGTVAIRSSGNVSSITDNGTGYYTVNFTTAMPDTNYTVVSDANYMNGANSSILTSGPRNDSTYTNTFATGSVRIQSSDQNQNGFDAVLVSVAIFR